ncbi:hypothetical protein ASA1KI_35510 [Opitutales bacterium ASA1]|uniref:ATP-binding protein n=1 Tax=Congregicoccus parvus TaxID=3081749 RepID=UPI002B31C637|nr:hypothetical protein ASA1KI_35510 [Opitutales bacterium ASA1]
MTNLGGGRFFRRLFLSYALLVVAASSTIGWLVLGHLRDLSLREFTKSLEGTARVLAATASANPAHLWSRQLRQQIDEVSRDTGLHLTYALSDGRILAESSPHSGPATSRLLALPEIQDARTHRYGVARRALGDAGDHLLVAVPILLEYELIGYVRAGLPLSPLAGRAESLRNRVALGASLAGSLALLLGFVFARNVTRPLEAVADTCRALGAGRLDARVGLSRNDEFGVVARTVDDMAADLQRRIDEETRERRRLTALLAAMTDGVVAVTARGTIAFINEVALRVLALDSAAAREARFAEVAKPAAVVEVYREALDSGSPVQREIRVAGHPHHTVLSVFAAPLYDSDGTPRGALVVLHDLTELRRLEEIRRKFSANVSHELKTPLAAIASLLDAMLDDTDMVPEVRNRFLGRMRDQTDRLQSLVQDLLALSRLESERAVLALTRVHAGTLVAPCMRMFAPLAEQKNIALETEVGPGSLWMHVDEKSARLVVSNLLQNAVHYTPPAGRVTIALSSRPDAVCIEVRDTGIGIAPEHVDRIFERFYRVDSARSRQVGGTGLGLAIVKHLTVAMGGQVSVESELGLGSTFRVQFRAAPSVEEAPRN